MEQMKIEDMTTEQKWALLGQKHELAMQVDREIMMLRQSLAQEQNQDGED